MLCFSVNLVAGNDVAYIQIFDLMDQNKTSSMDPALVLDEELSADLYAVSNSDTALQSK